MFDSVRQLTRLHRPWDSPGKNTGVGCHFLLQCMKVKSESKVAQSCPTLSNPMGLQPTRLLHPWDFPGKSTEVGFYCLPRNHSRILYDPPHRILEIKAKINKWDLIEIKSFCATKETISKVKRQPLNGRK